MSKVIGSKKLGLLDRIIILSVRPEQWVLNQIHDYIMEDEERGMKELERLTKKDSYTSPHKSVACIENAKLLLTHYNEMKKENEKYESNCN